MLKFTYDVSDSTWVKLRNRRLQNWGKLPSNNSNSGCSSSNRMNKETESLPPWIKYISDITLSKETGIFNEKGKHPINHCLLNEYKPGQGIMPHMDGPRYYPQVATISLGSPCIISFYKHLNKYSKVKIQYITIISICICCISCFFSYKK